MQHLITDLLSPSPSLSPTHSLIPSSYLLPLPSSFPPLPLPPFL